MWGWPPRPAACVLLSVCLFWVGTPSHVAQRVCGFGVGGRGDPSVVRSRVGVVSGRGQLVGSGDSSLEEKGLPCLLKGGCNGPPDLGTCGWLMGDENLVP